MAPLNTPPAAAHVTYPVVQSALTLYIFCSITPVGRAFKAGCGIFLYCMLGVVCNTQRDSFAGFSSKVELSLCPGNQHCIDANFATLLTFLALFVDAFVLRNGKGLTRHSVRVKLVVVLFVCLEFDRH